MIRTAPTPAVPRARRVFRSPHPLRLAPHLVPPPIRTLALALALTLALILTLAPPHAYTGTPPPPPPPADLTFFREQIEPTLREHCFPCHSHAAGKMKAGLTLDSRSGWALGGDRGPAIIPGSIQDSPLVQAVRRCGPASAMPPSTPLPAAAVEALVEWVRRGAPDPRVATVPASRDPADAWALRPLAAPPPAPSRTVGDHPIDARVAAELATLAPASTPPPPPPKPADRRTLLRRLTVDLHGILPSPEEVRDFERDPAPDAFERRVDRLLASPRYGERWARHWLDLAHFAETHGHDQDRPRESAWPYRDYLVEAFNQDRPYARFLQEQIAADALFPEQPDRIPALGFLAAGPWDESSLRDIREDTVDRDIGRVIDRDDIVANVMSTFASVTAHCARCHDHKFDPIDQNDYYALQAVFAGTEKAERPYDLDPAIHRQRQFWMRVQVAIDRRDFALLEALATAGLRRDQAAWEASAATRPVAWSPLATNLHALAARGSLALQPDLSLLAQGPAAPTNVYTVTARLPPARWTALRLELLTDDSLPARGPGRAANGNLHLTGFRLLARGLHPPQAPFQSVALVNPSSDFDQDGWDITKALDADPATGWGIHPREGQPHVAVFEIADPAAFVDGAEAQFILEQAHGREHTLGRFRLSLTTEPPPVRAATLPAPILDALACPAEQRSPAQRFTLLAHYLGQRATTELARLPAPRRVFAGASLFPPNGGQKPTARPRPVRVLRRGEVLKPIDLATPGALACVRDLPARFDPSQTAIPPERLDLPEEAGRRAALARWLAHRDNPLVWRSIVNRVWQHHFGRGLVDTPNDFGRMGSTPSAPRLLDWLAVTFRDDLGGSLKALHRLILTSQTWQQPSASPESPSALRPLRRRLDAESFRDSLLQFSGQLDSTMGGPSDKHFAMSPGIHVTPKVDYHAFDPDALGSRRRSIYRFLFRTLPDPLMDTLDSPAGDQSAPIRGESFTALQAFALLNHPFVVRQAEHLADRLAREAPDGEPRIQRACQLVWQRDASPDETEAFARHARRHGLAHLCRVLLNSNELHFLD